MRTFSHNYESEITREQFELIRPELEGARKKTKPRRSTCTASFAPFCTLPKAGYSGAYCRATSRKGVWSEKKKDGGTVLAGVLEAVQNLLRDRSKSPQINRDKTVIAKI